MTARWAPPLRTFAVTAALALADHAALAVGPTTQECLATSDASMKDASLRREHADLVICSARSCPTDIRDECARRAAEVSARIPTVRFSVRSASGEDLREVRVRMGSELLTTRLDGKPISVEPGEHDFTFQAALQPEVTKRLVFREGEHDRSEVIVLGASVSPATASPARSTAPVQHAAPEPAPTTDHFLPAPPPATTDGRGESGLGMQRVLGLLAGGVGVAGLGVGVASTFVAISKKSDAEGLCPATLCASQQGVDAWASARTAGDVSTVGFLVGAAGVAAGLMLWFTAPSSRSVRAGIGPGVVQVGGAW